MSLALSFFLRIEIAKSHKRSDKATSPVAADAAQPDKNLVVKGDVRALACRSRDSSGSNHKDHEGALSFIAMFKCTAAETPKLLFRRANPSEDSNEQVMSSCLLSSAHIFSSEIKMLFMPIYF